MDIINKEIDDFINRKVSVVSLPDKQISCTYSAIPAIDKDENPIFEIDKNIVRKYYPQLKKYAIGVIGIDIDPETEKEIIPDDSMYLAGQVLYTKKEIMRNLKIIGVADVID